MALAEQAAACSRRARASGALAPIDTDAVLVEDGGLPFVLRTITSPRRKIAVAADGGDPFAPPYEPDLFVAELSATHVVLLNKFPVLDRHLLLVTRAYRDQEAPLTESDCEALLRGLAEIDGLAFYNSGRIAGASQPHKHLQLAPLPPADAGPPLPFADALARARFDGEFGRVAAWPFPHAVTRLEPAWLKDPAGGAGALADRYRRLLAALDLNVDSPAPYNLLATRDRLWLVPRSKERAAGISVNALGFAGALLAPDLEARDALLRKGPMRVLVEVVGSEA